MQSQYAVPEVIQYNIQHRAALRNNSEDGLKKPMVFPAEQYFIKQKQLAMMEEKKAEEQKKVKVPVDVDMQIPTAKVEENQHMKMEQTQTMVVGNNKVTFNL